MSCHGHRGLAMQLTALLDTSVELHRMAFRPVFLFRGDEIGSFHKRPFQVHITVPRTLTGSFPLRALAGTRDGVLSERWLAGESLPRGSLILELR